MGDSDLISQQEARDAVDAAYGAFGTLSTFDQDRINSICEAMAGAALGFLHFVLKKQTASMLRTYRSWILIAGIGFIVVFLGRIPTIVGVTLVAIYAFKEFAHASGLYRDSWMTGAVYAGIVAVGIASLISDPRGEEPGPGWYAFFVAIPAFAI